MRGTLSCLLLALLASLAGNAWLAGRALDERLALAEFRLDPLGLAVHPTQPALDPSDERPRVVFFGDSRARNWTPPALPGFAFLNLGIGGETSTQAAERFERHVAPLDPRVVVVQVGVNDLKLVSLLPQRRPEIVAACSANIEQIVLEARGLGATVVLATIFPVGRVPVRRRLFFSSADTQRAIEEVNEGIRSLADEQVLVLDAAALLADREGGLSASYALDWLHLAPAGYRALDDELARLLRAGGS